MVPRNGKKCNAQAIIEVASTIHIPVEVGGGIRSMEDVDFYLSKGVSRVILGTAALEDETFIKLRSTSIKKKLQ